MPVFKNIPKNFLIKILKTSANSTTPNINKHNKITTSVNILFLFQKNHPVNTPLLEFSSMNLFIKT